MKRTFLVITSMAAVLFVLGGAFTAKDNSTAGIEMPEDIGKIIKKSCIGCHSDKSKNTKGKTKMNFDNLLNGKYSKGKQIAKLNSIVKTLSKGKMPPPKFLKKHPERALLPGELKTLSQWAKNEMSTLMGK